MIKVHLPLKRAMRAALFVLLLSVAGLTNATAQTFAVGNLNYSLNDDGASVTVTGYVDGQTASGELVIPESVEQYGISYPVTGISSYAFQGSGMTSVIIGNAVTTIGSWAFSSCYSLSSATIGNSVQDLGSWSFWGCGSLTSITIPESVTLIGAGVFYNSGLVSVNYCATHCSTLYSGTYGYWLNGCNYLTNLTIGDNVVIIPHDLVSGHSSLTGTLTIPESVTTIGSNAFNGCSGFTGSLTFGNSLISIGDGAFANCTGFTGSLTIPSNVTSIGANTFSGCTGFSGTLTLGGSLSEIGSSAFFGSCEGITSIEVLAENPPTLGNNVFVSADYGIPVQVPCGALDAYNNASGWDVFTNIQEPDPCLWDITATANPEEGGTIIGVGAHEQGTTCTLTAMPNEGYEFRNWTEDGQVVSVDAEYSFIVEGNRTFVANFGVPLDPVGTVVASYNPDSMNPESPYVMVVWGTNPFEAMIGDEASTTTTTYMPFYPLYNYSISEALFTANELAMAGVNTSPMTSLSWEAVEVTTHQNQNNISIWMANVTDTELTTTSHLASNMTLVYTGNIGIPPVGWNEFVFNEGTFAWDGTSNILILCQRNNGQWNGSVKWRSHNPGFNGMTYKYQDDSPYFAMNSTYEVTCSNTSRPNTLFKSTINRDNGVYKVYRADCEGNYYSLIADNVTSPFIDSSWLQLPFGSYQYGVSFANNEGIEGEIVASNCIDRNLYTYQITAVPNVEEFGTVNGGGEYVLGDTCTLTAVANEGYEFYNWTEDGEEISTDAEYTFVVAGERVLTARFKNPNTIVFADATVETRCVELWDTDGDGFLSYEEAAAVTTLDYAFRDWSSITTFDELQYFTGLTYINEWEMSGCTNLTSIVLPESLTTINYAAFEYSNALQSIVIPEGVTYIGGWAFSYCYALTSMTMQSGTPPEISDDCPFCYTDMNNVTIMVPCGAMETYLNTYVWDWYSNYDEPSTCVFDITVTVSPEETGTVSGAGSYQRGDTCTVTVTPNLGCSFLYWEENGEMVSTESEYTFTVTTNHNFVAHIYNPIETVVATYYPDFGNPESPYVMVSWGNDNAGWHTYCESEFDNAYRSNSSNSSWGYEYPSSMMAQYAGTQLTKVAVFSDNIWGAVGGNFTCSIYIGGTTPEAGMLASTITVDVPVGLGEWVEYDLTSPVFVDGSNSLWVIWHANSTSGYDGGYPAGCTSHSSEYGDWWNGGNGWGHMSGSTWTMKNYFSFGDGRSVCLVPATPSQNIFITNSDNSSLSPIADETNSGYECINPKAIASTKNTTNNNRDVDHFRVFRTGCDSDDFSFIAETESLSFIDSSWLQLPIGSYKYGVSVVDNNGEESEITITNCIDRNLYMYEITATPNFDDRGSVSGTGEYAIGNICTLTATPNEGHSFVRWTENGEEVSTEAEYSFTALGSRNLVAVFTAHVNDIIVFADATVEARCVELWDTDTDGYLSYDEAAVVTNLDYAFNYNEYVTSFDELQYFTGLAYLNESEFSNCYNLASIIIPEGVTYIGYYAFSDCYNLVSVIFPSTIETIDEGAFYSCVSLTSAEIPNSVVTIGWGAFQECSSLASLTLPESLEYIDNQAFYYCSSLTGALELPANVTYIGNFAFAECSNLTSLVLPENVVSIGNWAFQNCSGLRGEITLPETLESVGGYAFYGCDGISTVNYNAINCQTMGSAGEPVFYDCAFSHLRIGENVENIPDFAFKHCFLINEISTGAVVPPTIYSSTFGMVSRSIPVHVPVGSGDAYRNAPYWEEFFNITEDYSPSQYTNHWNADPNQFESNMTVIGVIQVYGEEQATDALEIGAFFGDECRGSQMLAYYPGLDRYMVFLTLHGEMGDLLTFRLYDHEANAESPLGCATYLPFVTDTIVGSMNDPYVFNFTNMQASYLPQGWTWYSTYVEQDDINGLEQLEQSLGGNGLIIKSQADGYVTYTPSLDLWYGSLNAIDNESAYLINTTESCVVNMVGATATPSDHPIILAPGWNWIGYPCATSMDINTALSGLEPMENDMLKAQEGFSVYHPQLGWIGALHTLNPSMGLMYRSYNSESTVFVYPDAARSEGLLANVTSRGNHWEAAPHAYSQNMSVIAVVELDGTEQFTDNYELAAFANGECRGSARLLYVESLDRYMAFLTVAGEEVTELYFGLYNTETEEELVGADQSVNFSVNAVLGSVAEPYVVSFRGTTTVDEWARSLHVYPNPVEHGQAISLGNNETGEVRVEIVNALGMVVETQSITSLQAITAPNVAGVYTLRITVEGKGTCIKKLVVR